MREKKSGLKVCSLFSIVYNTDANKIDERMREKI
jgi:hypothetical protein